MTTPEEGAGREENAASEPAGTRKGEASEAAGGEEGERPGAGRPRLAEASVERRPGSRVRVQVALRRAGERFEAEREGVGEEVMLLRLAAEATLAALDACVGRPGHFEFVGARRISAFDLQVALVCVRAADDRSRRLLGCVPATEGLVRAAATAALHATNRLVEAMPAPDAED